MRIPNDDEIAKDSADELQNAINKEIADAAANRETLRATLQNVRKYLLAWDEYAADGNTGSAATIYAGKTEKLNALLAAKDAVKAAEQALADAEKALADATATPEEGGAELITVHGRTKVQRTRR